MSSSATSTRETSFTRLTKVWSTIVLIGVATCVSGTLSVIAQDGDAPTPPPSVIPAKNTTIESTLGEETAGPDGAADRSLPPGAISPKLIAKTFLASAYSLKGQTASGITVRRGIIAADPKVLPLGSIVRLHAGKYSGIYTVLDTGGAIRGQRIDIYFPSRAEAIKFGKRRIKVEVLRHGWAPEDDLASAR